MKKLLVFLSVSFLALSVHAQMVGRMQVKTKIDGICDEKNVYVFLGQEGQMEATPPVSKKEIQDRLNKDAVYLKDSVNYNDKGMVSIIVNCKGEMVQCEIDNKTRHPELDQQIVNTFKSLGNWTAAELRGRRVDNATLWSFNIVNGKILLNKANL